MPGMKWLTEHWFEALESIGIVSGLVFTSLTMRWDEKSTRVTNLLTLKREHRELWTELYRRPKLARVVNPMADLKHAPVTDEESLFVGLLIVHLNATYQAIKQGVSIELEGLREDETAHKPSLSFTGPRQTPSSPAHSPVRIIT